MTPTFRHPPPPLFHPDLEFFRLLPEALRARLEGHTVERIYKDGDFIYHQDEAVPGIFQLLEGRWITLRTDHRGPYQVIQFLEPGSAMGIIPVLSQEPAIYGLQSRGISRCRMIPASVFRELVMEEPEGVSAVLLHFSNRVRKLVDMVNGLSLQSVPERVAGLLLERLRARPGSRLVEFEEDQDELGHHLGCTRSAFNRALRLLTDMGLIKTTFPVVRILDPSGLERFAGEGSLIRFPGRGR